MYLKIRILNSPTHLCNFQTLHFTNDFKTWLCITFQFSESFAFSFPVAFNNYIPIWNHSVITYTEQATHLYLIHSKWFISLLLACFWNLSKCNIISDGVCPWAILSGNIERKTLFFKCPSNFPFVCVIWIIIISYPRSSLLNL